MPDRHKVTGIGGVFLRSREPRALDLWYERHLGIAADHETDEAWWQQAGPTVWAGFAEDTDYFGRREQQWMVNFRVDDLDAMLTQLRADGVIVDEKTEHLEGIGHFGWAVDPEGNRFELWQPEGKDVS